MDIYSARNTDVLRAVWSHAATIMSAIVAGYVESVDAPLQSGAFANSNEQLTFWVTPLLSHRSAKARAVLLGPRWNLEYDAAWTLSLYGYGSWIVYQILCWKGLVTDNLLRKFTRPHLACLRHRSGFQVPPVTVRRHCHSPAQFLVPQNCAGGGTWTLKACAMRFWVARVYHSTTPAVSVNIPDFWVFINSAIFSYVTMLLNHWRVEVSVLCCACGVFFDF